MFHSSPFQSFAPNNKYVVSVGSQHDMTVQVFDWRTGAKVASNKVSMKVKAISFAENGNYFVTGSVQQSRLSSQFAIQSCNLPQLLHSEKCAISSQFPFPSPILSYSKWGMTVLLI